MRKLNRWQYQYLGIQRFPGNLTDLERLSFFTFSASELEALRSRFKPEFRAVVAIQLGFLKMAGHPLDKFKVVPALLRQHISAQLGTPVPEVASIRGIYKRGRRILYEHQDWAIKAAGFKRATDKQFTRLLTHLRRESLYKADINVLVESARVWLYQHGFLISADRPIRDYARQALSASEEGLYALICGAVPETTRQSWEKQLLRLHETTGTTNLEWLATPPRKGNTGALRERLDRIAFLKSMKVDKLVLHGVPLEKIRFYGKELQRMRPSTFLRLKDPTRTLRLICFLQHTLMEVTDTAVTMAGKQISKLWREAYERAAVLEGEQVQTARHQLAHIFEMADDPALTDTEFRERVRAVKTEQVDPEFPTRAAATRWILTEHAAPIRTLLAEVEKLDVQFRPDTLVMESFERIKSLYAQRKTVLPVDEVCHVAKGWRFILNGPDRERALRAFEADTLFSLKKALRSGAAWINNSGAFRNRDELLIGPERWHKERRSRFVQLNLPLEGDTFLDQLCAALRQRLEVVADAVAKGELSIEEGSIHISRLKAETVPAEVIRARDQLFKRIGVAQFPDVILEVDSQAGFSRALLGRSPKSEEELLKVYAGMLAHGTSMDASTLALMIPQTDTNLVLSGMHYFLDAAAVKNANDALSSYQRQFPIVSSWGDGSLASSDMMSLDVSRQIWSARLDPRRRVASVGTYTHVSDTWGIIYDQPIMLNERQAGAAIEGVIRQEEIVIDRLAVDTHGYTDFAMGQAKLLGFDLCPRLKSLRDRKLYVPANVRLSTVLANVATDRVHLAVIRKYWDELVRIAASIETGQVSATIALARFGSAAAGDPVYRAGVYLGRLVRSLFLCDYFTNEAFRRTINRILVHGEAVHQLQRAICLGSFSKPRGQREEELVALSGSLTLLTNICLAWTTSRIQAVVDDWRKEGGAERKADWLKAISPAHFKNINFHGMFRFAVSEYAERLFGLEQAAAILR